MAAIPLTLNPNYLAMVRSTRELHQLLAAGKDDSPEANAIRDATDGPWEALSEIERNRVRNLSEDLYSLVEPPPAAQAMNPQAQAKLNEAFEAKQRGEWDRALDLLRRWRAHIDPALVSYLRGSIWLEAGDPGTASLFLAHAARQQPDNENYLAMSLYALNFADPAAARVRADEILREFGKYAPAVVLRAADIKLMSARTTSEAEGQRVIGLLEPILKDTLIRFEQQEPGKFDRSSYVEALALLGFGCEFLGNTQAALGFYSQGLQLDPYNDALLIARGVLLYGTSPRAITDLEMAIRTDSPLIWPYVFLAHHNLVNHRFEECRKLCERALGMKGSPAVISEVSEWLAIAQAGLGFPAELVRGSFDNAIRFDPSNERAKRNLAAFEAANKPIAVNELETRSVGAVRTSGLAERRSAIADRLAEKRLAMAA
jgi:tetratricopeptide (TPR) repeat protein